MNTTKEIHIGLVLFDPRYIYIWALTVNCLKTEALQRGIRLTVAPIRSIEEQVAAINDLVAKGIDALIVKPLASDHPDLIAAVDAASLMGVPVVAMDATIFAPSLISTIGVDNAKGQMVIAEHVFECINGYGKVAYFHGDQRSEAGRTRTRGFRQALSRYPNIEVSYEAELDWLLVASRRTAGANLARQMLPLHADLRAIVCSTDDAALGAADAITEAGLTEQIIVCGFDAIPDALLAIVATNMAATIRYSPVVLACNLIETLLAALRGEQVAKTMLTEMELVSANNVCRASISSLQMMPGMISMLLDNDEAHRKLHAVASAVSSIRDLNQMMQNVVDVVHERFDLHSAALYRIVHPAEGSNNPIELEQQASSVTALESVAEDFLQMTAADSLMALCLDDKRSHVSHKSPAESQPHQINSKALFPLNIGGEIIGVMNAQSFKANAFDTDTVMVLQSIADQIAVALENARLYTETVGAYRALSEHQEQLLTSEKMASLGRLTAGIAHEMNTPLAAVRAAVSELKNLIAEYRDSLADPQVTVSDHKEIIDEMDRAAELASRSAERAAGFIRGIKSQTRDLTAQQFIWFNAVPVIEETILLLSHALRAQNCVATFSPSEKSLDLYGSPAKLAQVLTNLISNAIDASASRGGGAIKVRLAPKNNHLELKVSDSGSGIPAELFSKIFDHMFTTKPFGQGTGLGLTIVYDIVTSQFNGSIDVDSEIGTGTTFTILLAVPPKES